LARRSWAFGVVDFRAMARLVAICCWVPISFRLGHRDSTGCQISGPADREISELSPLFSGKKISEKTCERRRPKNRYFKVAMTRTVSAIHEDGVLRPSEPLPIAEHGRVPVNSFGLGGRSA
jgi:hypothetical protein